jgi:methanogenic corrinoid protein MtbC1
VTEPATGERARRYGDAIAAGDDGAAQQVVDDALAAGVEPVQVIEGILTPAMRRIGDLWEENRIGIADEHLATAITERVLARLYPGLFTASPLSRDLVLVSGVEGERHMLGLRMVADILEGNGYEVVFLGADVYVKMLLAAIKQHQPAAIALGCTGNWSTAALHRTLECLRDHPSIPVIVGGAGVPDDLPTDGLAITHVRDAGEVPTAVAAAVEGRERFST